MDGGLRRLDACVTPVLSPWEAHLHPHNIARGSFIEVDGIVQPAPAPRFGRSRPAVPSPIDDGGRDPAATLASWGIPEHEIADLIGTAAIR